MAEFTGTEYKDVSEVMDGNTYNRCTFTNCRLVYRGGTVPFLRQCSFYRCSFSWEDGARRTLDFLKGIYHGFGENGRKLVNDTFENIRTGGGWS